MKRVRKGWHPNTWASIKPFGIGEQRPNNYLELWKALRENRDQLPYAWRILNQGVCDGCALGTSGMRDWTLDGVHLCNIRLRLLRLNTMPALDPALLADRSRLEHKSSAALRELGRLPFPMLRRRGEPGFRRISWDTALDLCAEHVRATSPERLAFYLTSRGMPNESYYAAQKAVRALGSNSIDNAARICHSPSTVALKEALGVSATTCSYRDWIGTDLVVFIGSNVANNQPVATKYLYYAKKAGTRVVTINTYREPGMERYWVPSVAESALFGTKITDHTFMVNTGGDVAFLNGALRHLAAAGLLDTAFIREHTTGFEAVLAELARQSWDELERVSGATRADMTAFAELLGRAKSAVLVWSMGVTQHDTGENQVRAIINLALSRGFLGRDGCGLMPIRGHSGVQGGAEMGAYATALPGTLPITSENAATLGAIWGFDVPLAHGLTAPEMIDAAAEGRLDVLFSAGGNFLEVMPDPAHVERALARVPLRIHMDIVLTSQMLVEPAGTVLLLPAATRYEIPGGVTETSTERRVIFSPEIPGPRIAEARAEWEVFLELAARARPELGGRLRCSGTAELRAEIARVVPHYDGIQHLRQAGDQFQYGGPHLCPGGVCPTPDGRARFLPARLPALERPAGQLLLSTRRGKQFNSMVHEQRDALNGARRDAVMLSRVDIERLGLAEGDAVVVWNERGELHGRVRLAPILPGNVQVHWPEGNVLLDRARRSPTAGVPDYNALVRVRPAPAETGTMPSQ
jgi:molybdopterin-dependent oxidoreductase alpha subunit